MGQKSEYSNINEQSSSLRISIDVINSKTISMYFSKLLKDINLLDEFLLARYTKKDSMYLRGDKQLRLYFYELKYSSFSMIKREYLCFYFVGKTNITYQQCVITKITYHLPLFSPITIELIYFIRGSKCVV